MISRDYAKVKHIAEVKEALRQYKAAYAKGGPELKAAEDHLNAVIEKHVQPHGRTRFL